MPQNKPVTLNYSTSAFGPTPNPVKVRGADTIVFTLGPDAPPASKLRITIKDGQHFSHKVVKHSSSQAGTDPLSVKVKDDFSTKTSYKCELLDGDGNVLRTSDGDTGGEIELDPGR